MHVSVLNIAGCKFAKACGFQLEGIHHKHRIVHGANQDTCVFALLNSDWLQVKSASERKLGMKAVTPAESEDLAPTANFCSAALDRDDSSVSFGADGTSSRDGSVRK